MKRMNYIKILCFSAVITGLGSIVSCGDAKYDTLDTHAYIEEALSSTSQKVTVQATGESFTTLNVHLSNLSSTDNHYKLVTDQSVLDTYNHINGTGYIMLPKDYYTLPETITVKAGQYAADALSIALKAFSQEMMKSGESYALPVKLVSQDGSISPMENTGTFVILAESIIEFSAPMFVGAPSLKANKFTESPETYSQYTIEVRFQVANTADRDRAVFKNGGDDANFILLPPFSDIFLINHLELLIPEPCFFVCCKNLFSYLLFTFSLYLFHWNTALVTANRTQNAALPAAPTFRPGASNFSSRL